MKKLVLVSLLSVACVLYGYAGEKKVLEVYESPTCGCCEAWARYMQKKGYEVNVHKTKDFMTIKTAKNISPQYQSCHTGIIDNYAIEGHVPESAIKWLLENKPKGIIGIAAPGMPQGSPGMEQGIEEQYRVLLLKQDGGSELYGEFIGERKVK